MRGRVPASLVVSMYAAVAVLVEVVNIAMLALYHSVDSVEAALKVMTVSRLSLFLTAIAGIALVPVSAAIYARSRRLHAFAPPAVALLLPAVFAVLFAARDTLALNSALLLGVYKSNTTILDHYAESVVRFAESEHTSALVVAGLTLTVSAVSLVAALLSARATKKS